MNAILINDILKLSITERIQLVENIWDTIIEIPEIIELSEEQKKELDKRLKSYHKNPNIGTPWKKLKATLQNGF